VTKGACYICMSSSELHTLQRAFAAAGGKWSTFIIWAKNTFTLGRADYQRQYEPILYGWKDGSDHYWCGARDQGDVWFFDKPVRNDLHPTMKPVALVERAIRNSSKSRDIVLDPFGGSGSTLIACEKAGRQARLIELEPKYVDTIILRWQEFSGGAATLNGDGRSYEEIAAGRVGTAAEKKTRAVAEGVAGRPRNLLLPNRKGVGARVHAPQHQPMLGAGQTDDRRCPKPEQSLRNRRRAPTRCVPTSRSRPLQPALGSSSPRGPSAYAALCAAAARIGRLPEPFAPMASRRLAGA
jgi:DNA methylase